MVLFPEPGAPDIWMKSLGGVCCVDILLAPWEVGLGGRLQVVDGEKRGENWEKKEAGRRAEPAVYTYALRAV
jgi:hypothetical protein